SLVAGTITGPVFTNGSWNFGTGQYTFTDNVGQAGPSMGTSNGCPSGVTKLPSNVTAQQGIALSQQKVTLPTNSFNQESAVLNGRGAAPDGSPLPKPSMPDMSKALNLINGTPYPGSGTAPKSGVYLPYTPASGGNPATFNGGGILVSGDASVKLNPTTTGQG